jgi:glycosyltransferase involved in cell wall biosynthesis
VIVTWRRGTTAAHLVDDALGAVTAADWTADRPPVAWVHWPIDLANPYQALIYSRFARHGLVPIRLRDLDGLDELRTVLPPEVPCVLHVHWLYAVTAGGADSAAATAAVERFEATLDRLRDRGVRLVWTVHNLLPHEAVHRDAQTRLRRLMLDRADVVHLMDEEQERILAATFGRTPHRTVVVPHPSYVGALPDWTDRAGARAHLGIPLGARVLTTFGQIRPYKGHADFFDVLDAARERDPFLRWLVAGKVRDEPGGDAFVRRAAAHPATILHPEFVPDGDVQQFLRAADAVVFPYRASLNSGAVALAASFGLPAYATAGTRLGGLMPEEAVARFDVADPQRAGKLIAEGAIERADLAERVRARADSLAPAVVSDRLARELAAILFGQTFSEAEA